MPEQTRDASGATHIGQGRYLRFHPDEGVWWSHSECQGWHPLTEHRVIFGPGGITVAGSVRCPDTGIHGWISEGVWRDA